MKRIIYSVITNLINEAFSFLKREKILCTVTLILLFLVRIIHFVYVCEFKYKSDESNKKMYVRVLEKQKETDEKCVYLVKYESHKFVMNVYKEENTNVVEYRKNDILLARAKVVIPKCLGNPCEFNYKRYLNSENIVRCNTSI